MSNPLDVMRTIVGTEWSGGPPTPQIKAMEAAIVAAFPEFQSYLAGADKSYFAWCGFTLGYCCAQCGIRPINEFLLAANWRTLGSDASGSPQQGDVAVAPHHVTIIDEVQGSNFKCLGGNQSHEVKDSTFPQSEFIAVRRPPAAVAQPTMPRPAGPSNFDAALPLLLASEGGNDDDPQDPGGRTSRGILQREWDRWRASHPGLPSDVWQAPDDQVATIYRQNYWDALSCDRLGAGVDYAVFDFGVNSGISRAAKFLQAIVGTDQDGEIGPLTIAATAKADPATVINTLCDHRLSFLAGLGTWGTFGHGWSARVTRVRADSLSFAAKGKPMTDTTTTTTTPAPAGTPPLKSGIDPFALFDGIKRATEEAVTTLTMLNTAWQAFQSGKPIPGVPTLPAPALPPVVLPAPAPAPSSAKQPSVWLSLAAFGGATLLQLLGMVGAPVAIPGLIPTTAVTANGALASLIPLISAAFGKGGGWSIVGKVLGAIGPALGQALANSNAAQPPAAK